MKKLITKRELIISISVFIAVIILFIMILFGVDDLSIYIIPIGIIGWIILILIKSVILTIQGMKDKTEKRIKMSIYKKIIMITVISFFIGGVIFVLFGPQILMMLGLYHVETTNCAYTGGPQPIKDIEVKVSKEDIGDTRRIIVDLTIIPAIENTPSYIHITYDKELIFINKKEYKSEGSPPRIGKNRRGTKIIINTNKKEYKFIFEIDKNLIDKQIIALDTGNGVLVNNTVNIYIKDLIINYYLKGGKRWRERF